MSSGVCSGIKPLPALSCAAGKGTAAACLLVGDKPHVWNGSGVLDELSQLTNALRLHACVEQPHAHEGSGDYTHKT